MKLGDPTARRDAKTGSFVSVGEKGRKPSPAHAARKQSAGHGNQREGLENLPTMTASQLKKGGWPGVMAQVSKTAAVVVTNHHRTDAVILTAEHYTSLMQRVSKPKAAAKSAVANPASREIELARLQSSFDQRLAKLKDGKSLAAVTSKRARRGKVTIGTSL